MFLLYGEGITNVNRPHKGKRISISGVGDGKLLLCPLKQIKRKDNTVLKGFFVSCRDNLHKKPLVVGVYYDILF